MDGRSINDKSGVISPPLIDDSLDSEPTHSKNTTTDGKRPQGHHYSSHMETKNENMSLEKKQHLQTGHDDLNTPTLTTTDEDPKETADSHGSISIFNGKEVIWVDWKPNDPDNPLNWNSTRKWVATTITVLFTVFASTAGAAYSLGVEDMQTDLHNSRFLGNVGLSMYPLGFGLPPLLLAPFSEVFGRNGVYIPSLALLTIFFIIVALAQNIETVLVGRFLCGAAASTGSTMVGGSLADIWESHERGIPMAMFSFGAFVGTGFGPLYAGWTTQNINWRWIEWISMMLNGSLLVAFVLFLKESRASVLLSRKAAKLRKTTGDERYQCRADFERASLSVLIKTSLSRPIAYLLTEPVVFVFSIWTAFVWGLMWALLPALSLVLGNVYDFSTGQLGTSYLAITIGSLVGTLLIPLQEHLYAKRVSIDGPESRLYSSMLGGLLTPIGCFIFGWTQGRTHWVVPLIGVAVMMLGNFAIYLSIFSYLADAYTLYASSAIAAQSLARNLSGFAFPMFTDAMYNKLGYSWAASLVAFIALGLATVPFVLYFYGPKLRARSKALLALQADLERLKAVRMEQDKQTQA